MSVISRRPVRRALAPALLLVALLATACKDRRGPLSASIPLANPAPAGSAQPDLVRAPDGTMWLSWQERAADSSLALMVAPLRDTTWGPAHAVVRGPDLLSNWADVPRLVALADGRLVMGWLRGQTVKGGYDLMITSSADGGATWRPSEPAHHDGLAAEHGFVSFFPQGDRLGLVWLDGRNYQLADSARHETQLMYATMDEHGQLAREFAIDERICDCCQTAATVPVAGTAVIAYRDRSREEVRDIWVKRLTGNVVGPGRAVHPDNWRINGCPVNGPSLASDGARVALAWFTAPSDTPHVRLAFSPDTGTTWGKPIEVHEGRPEGRVAVALVPGGDALVVWVEQRTKDVSALRVRRVSPAGSKGLAGDVAVLTGGKRASGFPRIVVRGKDAIIAWTDPAKGKVETARIPLAPPER